MVAPVVIALGCFSALVLVTVALVRGVPRIVWAGAVCCFAAAIALVLLLRDAGQPRGETREIPITPQYASSVRAAGFPITVQRALEANSFGGFHGDGASVTIYRYPATESDALVSAVKTRERGFTWSEVPAQKYDFSSLRRFLPSEFLPAPDAWSLLVGRPAEGPPVSEIVIDPARGTLYCITNVF